MRSWEPRAEHLRNERKDGNHWFFRDVNPKHEQHFGPTVFATEEETQSISLFFGRMPIALEREDLRVVHAAWLDDMINDCRDNSRSAFDVYRRYEERASTQFGSSLREAYKAEMARHAEALPDADKVPPRLAAVAAYDEYCQYYEPLSRHRGPGL
jgi:hypothetical protein